MRTWTQNDCSYTEDKVRCEHCLNKAPMKSVGEGDYVKDVEFERDPSQIKYRWRILICQNCENVNVLQYEEWSETEPEFDGEDWKEPDPVVSWLYPINKKRFKNASYFFGSQNAYDDAAKAYKVGLYDLTVLSCRKSLELLCEKYGVKENNLLQSLEVMRSKKFIDGIFHEWADALRSVGNEAAHGYIRFSQEDAKDTLDFTYSFIEYCVDLRGKFKAFKQRQGDNRTQSADVDDRLEVLSEALRDSNKYLRCYAADSLAEADVDADGAIGTLLDLLKSEESTAFLKIVGDSLVRIGGSAVPFLVDLIKQEVSAEETGERKKSKARIKAAISALAKIGGLNSSDVSLLVKLLLDDAGLEEEVKIELMKLIKRADMSVKIAAFDTYREEENIN